MCKYVELITGWEGLGSRLKITTESVSFPWQSALLEQTFQQVYCNNTIFFFTWKEVVDHKAAHF